MPDPRTDPHVCMADDEPEDPGPPGGGRPAGWLRRGRDQVLAERLLQLGPAERLAAIAAIESDPGVRIRRLSIAQLLVRKAEWALEDRSGESEEAAELALAIAGDLDGDERDEARRTCAMASWLLGKARLRSLSPAATRGRAGADWGRLTIAAVAFAQVTAFPSAQPSWERALSAVGLAQVQWLLGQHLAASALFAAAALLFSRAGADEPVAACQVQHGFLLLGTGDRMLARIELAKAERRLDARRTPTLTVLTAIGLASCAAAEGRSSDAAAHLAEARAVWRAMPRACPAIPAAWREMLAWEENLPAAELSDRTSLALLTGSPWRSAYPEALVTLADRLLLGRAEDEPALRTPPGSQATEW